MPATFWAITMNKGELIDEIAEKTGATKKQTDVILSALTETIIDAVRSDEKVTLVGFGSFEARDRKARDGHNPQTGKKLKIPATRVPAFSAGKEFKEKVKP